MYLTVFKVVNINKKCIANFYSENIESHIVKILLTWNHHIRGSSWHDRQSQVCSLEEEHLAPLRSFFSSPHSQPALSWFQGPPFPSPTSRLLLTVCALHGPDVTKVYGGGQCCFSASDVSSQLEVSPQVKPHPGPFPSPHLGTLWQVKSAIKLVDLERMNWECLAQRFPRGFSTKCRCTGAGDKRHKGGVVPGSLLSWVGNAV